DRAHSVGPWRDTGAVAPRMMARSLVGRDTQLAQLEAALQDAAAGRPSFVFVAGEPGLGKTRLLDELHARVRDAGTARVLAGDCLALGEGELPYAPLVGALRPLARSGETVLDGLPASTRAALATRAPSLAPGHLSAPSSGGGGGPFGESPQSRVFEALLELVDVLSATTPVVLTLEDLHWADTSTRAFLRFLSVNLCRERVLVVCSFRPDELHRRHPLRPLLAELERDARATRITLEPLTDREHQVLELVAGGATNREIGATLFMAEKTASVHVSRILAELDVRSRTEAAAVAHRLGLAGESRSVAT
ncbi:MAG: transcriptional regulator, LuxR family, partial [Solirubrobacterales bacterium]|nr:transcriptional regulator, LuxR family [Solirubrobacterales bacterium]